MIVFFYFPPLYSVNSSFLPGLSSDENLFLRRTDLTACFILPFPISLPPHPLLSFSASLQELCLPLAMSSLLHPLLGLPPPSGLGSSGARQVLHNVFFHLGY